ncbi:MAG TPA: hypothetical protein VHA10_09285 [Hypericibacter adhaerens]|jgi:hypothetical protein|uniref:Uncharacterized protein n=1 Tax=Hypericibacter adhaerens TaxID=2602016 RepID=A0A5J6N233_9PROT|nr:hypothetical protein [Hypericibacter adhaerens]QEX23771.1 hypothetical protein FRZ61_37100 [Hypericibacter adhaerens]HWA43389.1 hypothetical protein [Hypericibacter adhaerens]
MKSDLATRLGRQGRGGDTLVAHISPREAMMLKLLGGSGTRNPRTGLLEFKYGGDTNEGGAHGFGGAGSAAAAGRSGGPMGGTGAAFKGMDSSGSISRSGVGSATAADKMVADSLGLSPDAYGGLAGAYRDQVTDSYDDGFGGLLDSLFGLREKLDYDRALEAAQNATQTGTAIDPTAGMASWGFDPAGLIGGLAGMALGVPGLGLAAAQISDLLGRPAEIGLGPDVFGGSTGSPSMTGTSQNQGQVAQGAGQNLNDAIGRIAAAREGVRRAAGARPPGSSTAMAAAPPIPRSRPPSGLLAYLAQNPAWLPGYSGSSRFGVGAVAPIPYLRPVA